jgi:hypothetical protein
MAGKYDNLSDLSLPISSLYRLTAPSTPDPVREPILIDEKARRLTPADVEARIAFAKEEAAAEERQIRRQVAETPRTVEVAAALASVPGYLSERGLGSPERTSDPSFL